MHNSENTALTVIPPPLKMSPKEEAFCLAIVEGLNESDAYRKAYKPQRAKAKTIHEKASRIMARGKVRARIAELMAPVIAAIQMNRGEWLEWLTKCCRFDPRKMFDAHGKSKPITELEENEAAAIAGKALGAHDIPCEMIRPLPIVCLVEYQGRERSHFGQYASIMVKCR